MKIKENFIEVILKKQFGDNFQEIYDKSYLIQYLDYKMGAIHGNSKTRRSLGNIYAVYSILYYYKDDFYNKSKDEYLKFQGYDYTRLFGFYRGLYGGNKLQNHSLNSRVNGEFRNKFKQVKNDLIFQENGKYLIHIDYLYVNNTDVSLASLKIIEEYIQLLIKKDNKLIEILDKLTKIEDYRKKREEISKLLVNDAEARIFEIISYAILKNHYKNIKVYFGYSVDSIKEETLELFKTGRTNANDGGIDFVMRPVGRFFQVTEVSVYDKFLLDIDKVMHFPISFVIKTDLDKSKVKSLLDKYIEEKSGGMNVIISRYKKAVEELITINELKKWVVGLKNSDIDELIRDIDLYYRLEMNMVNE